MEPNVYKLIELVGTSPTSIEDATQNAITRACDSLRNISWFEIIRTSGRVADGKVTQYQVELKVGFRLGD